MFRINILLVPVIILGGVASEFLDSCFYPKSEFKDEIGAAMLWGTLNQEGKECQFKSGTQNTTQNIISQYDSNLKTTPPPQKFLSRKKRVIYIERAPFISAEFRYVFPIFPVNRDLKTFVNIEVPINYFINVAHFQFEVAQRDFASKSSDVLLTLEEVLSMFGINGRSCVQRSICEVASLSPLSAKGILKDMISVVIKHMFRSSADYDTTSAKSSPYLEAAMNGRSGKGMCDLSYSDCPISILGLVQLAYE